jgi:alpha-beta hydrolase superfamily lysophospholipase
MVESASTTASSMEPTPEEVAKTTALWEEYNKSKEVLIESKVIDWRKQNFPLEDPIEILWKDSKGEEKYKIKNYKYPSNKEGVMKGNVYYFGAFGDRLGKYAYLGKYFADAGFDFYCFDFCNFGHSEGSKKKRFTMTSLQDCVDQQLRYVNFVEEKFGKQKTFFVGHSMGGMQTHLFQQQNPDRIDGCCYVAPYWGLHENIKEKLEGAPKIVKTLGKWFPRAVL